MTLRETFIRFRDLHNLQYCESPRESALLDRVDSDEGRKQLPGASRLACAAFQAVVAL